MEDNSMDVISDMLSNMRFRKKLIGGVDELDVWNKLEDLQKEYKRLYDIQARRYEKIIEELKLNGDTSEQE